VKKCLFKTCKVCGKEIWKNSTTGYCRTHFNIETKTFVQPHYCIDCGKELNKYNPSLRCYSCASKEKMKHRNTNGDNNPNFKGGKIELKCFWCGKIVYKWKHQIWEHSFCDEKCRGQWQRITFCGKNAINYIHGKGNEQYPLEFSDLLKDKIRNRDNYCCQICNLNEKEHFRGNKKIKLLVHHIDYNKQNCKEDNLLTVCSDCHIQTNYNRDYWFAYCKYIMDIFICYTKN
jgi:hypothetical protein